ncbi:starch-binding protein [Ruminococcus sp.]|uniref:starch-binding protein n=1 Tax=Ruminococcus sp. TaxID=41978 RepID=UPI00388EC08D
MKHGKKLTSLLLALCMVLSIAAIGVVPGAAATTYTTYAQDTIQGSNILHCFNWSYNNIKAALPDIAAAGYTAVQTSPVQRPKDYNASYTTLGNEWWKMYQPLGFSIAANNTSWLGTKAQLTSLCTEADKYGIKVVVDVVANHLANNGTDGGTYSYINSAVETDLKNSNYYHTNNVKFNDNSRYNITQYHLGMPDLNTGNSYVQQRVQGLLEECIDCGVDGFRFDAAKHIETPSDSSSFASDFWPNVLNGATAYAQAKGVDAPFYYGEILGTPGPSFNISGYTAYMAVTDNASGDRALYQAYTGSASGLANGTYDKGAGAAKSVLWVESHDTYMGTSGSVSALRNTYDVTADVLTKAWAIVGARADATGLYFARPNTTMGNASTDTTWKSAAVTEINKFKNHFVGTSESLSYSGNTTYLERGTAGVVISKLDGEGAVSLTAKKMANGTYTDQLTGNTFTVSGGTISGTVGSTGIAVVYNAGATPTPSPTTAPSGTITVNFTDALGWGSANVYYWNDGPAWPGTAMTKAEVNDFGQQVYTATIPANVTGVIFNNGSSQTVDITTDIVNGAWWYTLDEKDGNNYKVGYVEPTVEPTVAPTTAPTTAPTQAPTTAPSGTITVKFTDALGWGSANIYYWDNGPDWPGTAMTKAEVNDFGQQVYTATIPANVTGIVFNGGNSQTVDITTGIVNGAWWYTLDEKDNNSYKVGYVEPTVQPTVAPTEAPTSAPVTEPPVQTLAITNQPTDWTGNKGETATFTVAAVGQNLSYRWYYHPAGKTNWIDTGVTANTYSIAMSDARNGRAIYCKVTDGAGNSVDSNVVTMSYPAVTGPVITKQPVDWAGQDGEQVNISVTASGNGLTYQWFYWKAEKSKWIASPDTDASYDSITMESKFNGRRVYCKITDQEGNSVNSDEATISYASGPVITKQPENWYGKNGAMTNITVVAEGEGLTYQWFYRPAGKTNWIATTDTDATYNIQMSSVRNGRQVYCKITDKNGVSVNSQVATMAYPA